MSSYISLYSIHIYLPICLYVYIFIPDIHYPNCNRYAKLNRPNANPGGFPASSQSGRMQGFPQGLALGGNTIHRRYWQIAEYNRVYSGVEQSIEYLYSGIDMTISTLSIYFSTLYNRMLPAKPRHLGGLGSRPSALRSPLPLCSALFFFLFSFFLSCALFSYIYFASLPPCLPFSLSLASNFTCSASTLSTYLSIHLFTPLALVTMR